LIAIRIFPFFIKVQISQTKYWQGYISLRIKK
jgi:hypothetical protein